MPQTKQGAAANGWLQFQRQCAKDYHAQKQSEKDGGASHTTAKAQTKAHMKPQTKPHMKPQTTPQTNAQKAREVDMEVNNENTNATRLHKAATKQLHEHAVAVAKQRKAEYAPRRAARHQRLIAEAQKAQKAMHNDVVARAHATVLKRRREKP